MGPVGGNFGFIDFVCARLNFQARWATNGFLEVSRLFINWIGFAAGTRMADDRFFINIVKHGNLLSYCWISLFLYWFTFIKLAVWRVGIFSIIRLLCWFSSSNFFQLLFDFIFCVSPFGLNLDIYWIFIESLFFNFRPIDFISRLFISIICDYYFNSNKFFFLFILRFLLIFLFNFYFFIFFFIFFNTWCTLRTNLSKLWFILFNDYHCSLTFVNVFFKVFNIV